jgi:uncharacterized membrane protein YkoI
MSRLLAAPPLVLALALACSTPAPAADHPGTDANATPGAKAEAEAGSAQDASAPKDANADAKAHTKISEADARKTALASAPTRTVQRSRLVLDRGKQLWTFDLKSETSPLIIVIQVDANTGRMVSKSIKHGSSASKSKKS